MHTSFIYQFGRVTIFLVKFYLLDFWYLLMYSDNRTGLSCINIIIIIVVVVVVVVVIVVVVII